MATHFYLAIKHCEGDGNTLRAMLDSIVEHYKNDHKRCDPSSRCRVDPNYEPSRVVIENHVAEILLRGIILNSIIYNYPDEFKLGRDTYFVESFNNTLKIYQDKRIAFGSEQYIKLGLFFELATGMKMWGENSLQCHIDVIENPHVDKLEKKNYSRQQFQFRNNIWNHFMKYVFSQRKRN